MPETLTDSQPLTAFRDNPAEFLTRVTEDEHPLTLTIDGQPAVVLQQASAYQRLLDIAALADAHEGILQGLADVAAGRTRPAKEAFDELREKYGIPR